MINIYGSDSYIFKTNVKCTLARLGEVEVWTKRYHSANEPKFVSSDSFNSLNISDNQRPSYYKKYTNSVGSVILNILQRGHLSKSARVSKEANKTRKPVP
nr:hypothetical protein MACL_00001352 [Theileria orientalis]